MKSTCDFLTAIINCHLDTRLFLDWCSNSLDVHEVSLWGDKFARWYACRLRAAIARLRSAKFAPPASVQRLPDCCAAQERNNAAD